MKCPVCETRYERGTRSCPGCGLVLLPGSDRRGARPFDGPMRPAMVFETRAEAVAVHERLVEEGVRAYVPGEGWSEFGILGGWQGSRCEVWIADEDIDRAARLVEGWVEESRSRSDFGTSREPDFNDYESVGDVRTLDEYESDGPRRRALVRFVIRAVAWMIAVVFALDVLYALVPIGRRLFGSPIVPFVGLAFVGVLILIWSRRSEER